VKQQINLYRVLYPPKKHWPFSARATILSLLSIAAIAAMTYAASWKIQQLQQQYQFELSVKSIKETTFNNMRKQANESIKRDRENAELAALRDEYSKKSALLQLLEQQKTTSARGFQDHFVSLAKGDLSGVWLRNIHLENKNDGELVVSLAGTASSPALVARYIDRLSHETSFHGLNFTGMRITDDQSKQYQGRNYSAFLISTKDFGEASEGQLFGTGK